MKDSVYEFILKVQAISKIGLKHSQDPYAIENYQELNDLSSQMLNCFLNLNLDRPNYFIKDIYPTPNVSVRVIIFNEQNEVLLVQEKADGGYTLPGGWADIDETPKEAAIKECKQEAGADVNITQFVGMYHFSSLKASISQYCLVFKATLKGPLQPFGHEISDVCFAPIDNIPSPISWKLSIEDMKQMIDDAVKGVIHLE
jgi:8-oxo-dGTP pyrophosphatase MutT (NUDIX family)